MASLLRGLRNRRKPFRAHDWIQKSSHGPYRDFSTLETNRQHMPADFSPLRQMPLASHAPPAGVQGHSVWKCLRISACLTGPCAPPYAHLADGTPTLGCSSCPESWSCAGHPTKQRNIPSASLFLTGASPGLWNREESRRTEVLMPGLSSKAVSSMSRIGEMPAVGSAL